MKEEKNKTKKESVSGNRRQFLQGAAVSAASVAVVSAGVSSQAIASQPLKEEPFKQEGYRLTKHIMDYYKSAAN